MKRLVLVAALAATAAPALATDVGVSVSIGQPGFYGTIDIGNVPRPQVIYAEPVVIQPVPVGVVRRPVYLHVPPGHAKNWRRYCGRYDACGQPVYFVQERWYNEVYVPQHRAGRVVYREDDRHRYRDDERGHGRGKGKGKHRD